MKEILHYKSYCFLFLIFILTVWTSNAQSYQQKSISSISRFHSDSIQQKIKNYYSRGIRYKNGINTPIDYQKAFDNFKAAAELGDAQSIYAMAYFYYKGFVVQDYAKAAALFKQGAYAGRANSQYFLGLIYMNGYSVPTNRDSGVYWLNKAADAGYTQAIQELRMKSPENNDSAKILLANIKKAALPQKQS